MFGLTIDKLMILAVVAALLLGPSRIPTAAAWLGRLVRELRTLEQKAKARAREELGDEFDDIEWQKLDPRRYDPRRIIVEALRADGNDGESSSTPSQNEHTADPTASHGTTR
jgi:sec-independent protein translocase protein TatB